MIYFEGEIIGTKYSFTTRRTPWGATEMIDYSHWAKFIPFQRLAKRADEEPNTINSASQEENIFMRWKQTPLIPHDRVSGIGGGGGRAFYYLCLNLVKGQVSGYYSDGKGNE
jgi:hypothetical protein